MKKRFLLSALALLTALCILAGCQTGDTEQSSSEAVSVTESHEETSTESSFDTSSDDTSSEIELPPDEPIEEDYFTAHRQGVLPDSVQLPAICEPTETEHLYTFPIELPDAEGFSVQVAGDILQLSYWTEENECSFYSLSTGELLYETVLPAWNASGLLEDGTLWCANLAEFEVSFYDCTGNKTVVIEAAVSETEILPQNVSVTPDGRYLLALYSDNTIRLYDLKNGTHSQIQAPRHSTYWDISAGTDTFYLPTGTAGVVQIDCEQKTAVTHDTKKSLGALYGGLWQFFTEDAIVLGDADAESPRFYAKPESVESLVNVALGCAVTVAYDAGNTVRFYDLREGVLLAKVELGANYRGAYAVLLPSGAALLLRYSGYGTDVCMYDLPAAASHLKAIETFLMTDREVQAETDRIARETEQTTGVDLLYGSEGNDFVLYDYLGEAETDIYTVYGAVKTVSEILSRYPEGMLREAYEETHSGLQIYLCGTIYGKTDGTLSQAGGVTTDKDGYILVAVDVHNNLKYDIPHELSHVFDRRISYMSSTAERDWMMLWEAATPIENVYAYSYDEYYNYTRYVAWNESNDANVWFVDSYARTFPTEDRARILEHLFNPEEDGLAEVLQFEHLQEKARLYAYILRECFESCDVDEVLYWETHLGTIDESVIPQ